MGGPSEGYAITGHLPFLSFGKLKKTSHPDTSTMSSVKSFRWIFASCMMTISASKMSNMAYELSAFSTLNVIEEGALA